MNSIMFLLVDHHTNARKEATSPIQTREEKYSTWLPLQNLLYVLATALEDCLDMVAWVAVQLQQASSPAKRASAVARKSNYMTVDGRINLRLRATGQNPQVGPKPGEFRSFD